MIQPFQLIYEAGLKWWNDRCMRMAAALAFYSLLSIAPLLVIVIAVAGTFFGEEAARGEVMEQMESLVGLEGARAIEAIIVSASRPDNGRWASALGLLVLLVGASGVFSELQDAFNTIWRVQTKPGRAIWSAIKDRAISFLLVLGTGFLLTVSLVVSPTLDAFSHRIRDAWNVSPALYDKANVVISFLAISAIFALIFKYLPNVKMRWRVAWTGAMVTGVLFTLGKYLLGIYLVRAAIGSAYGAAGSLVVLIVWIYYSSLIMLFGAELTAVYAESHHEATPPTPQAESVAPQHLPSSGQH